jgi:hypothetical protein
LRHHGTSQWSTFGKNKAPGRTSAPGSTECSTLTLVPVGVSAKRTSTSVSSTLLR